MRSRIVGRSALLRWALAAVSAVAVTASFTPGASAAEANVLGVNAPNTIPGSYIVVLRGAPSTLSVTSQVTDLARRYTGTITHTYTSALHGFSGRMSAEHARQLAANPAVAYVEQNRTVRADTTQSNPPSYGIDRIDQRDLPLSNSYTYSTTASNVHAYVIDTGIRTTHQTFGGRASFGYNATSDGQNTDCNGHGTHVSGTIGGSQYGVAKGVKLVAVKVLGCDGSGTLDSFIAGIDWVTSNAVKPAVANMSLGFSGISTAADDAVRDSIGSGVTYSIASGNDSDDACYYSPADVAEAITVNASDSSDSRAYYSNYGTCTDIFAPGDQITSSWNTSDTATNTISGTSMATPHVTGAAALYLATHTTASPATVQTALKNAATTGRISDAGSGSPNRLLYTGS